MGGLWRLMPVTYVLMWIGSLALAGIPPFAGYFSKDVILEAAWASGTGVGLYAFWLGVVAAFLTAFYSWRLLFLTFHGKPRADQEVMHHVHESPKVMILPLVVLAAGRDRRRLARLTTISSARGGRASGAIRSWCCPTMTASRRRITCRPGSSTCRSPSGCSASPSPGSPISGGRRSRAILARRFRPIYLFLLNKWYFDELYDAIFVRPAMALGFAFWKSGDGAVIDGLGPDGIAATTARLAVWASRLQTGISLPLRLRHADRRRGAGLLVSPAADRELSGAMQSWPLLSLVTFLPLVGVLFILVLRGPAEAVARNARWIALWTSLITFALSLVLWAEFDPSQADFQFVELAPWLPDFNIAYHLGVDGISLFFVLLSTFLTPICVVASWIVDHRSGEGVHDRVPGAGDDDGRHVLRPRLRRLLHLLRGRAHPDVPHHRRLGRAAAGLFRLQVLPLHAAGLGADAAGHPGDLLPDRHDRHRRGAQPRHTAGAADLAVARLLRLLRRQGADVAGAYLAAGRACRGADRGLGDPGGRAAEDGRLRLHPLLAAALPGRLARASRRSSSRSASSPSSTPRWWRWRRRT